jgi:hypothetical protein
MKEIGARRAMQYFHTPRDGTPACGGPVDWAVMRRIGSGGFYQENIMLKQIVFIAGMALTFGNALAQKVHAGEKERQSDFRSGVTVQLIYHQKLDPAPYFTEWFGRLEKSDGAWRQIYLETSDKFVNKGLMRFNCADSKADIDLTLYGVHDYGDEAHSEVVRVRFADRQAWAKNRFKPLWGEEPPYLFYLAAHKHFCTH